MPEAADRPPGGAGEITPAPLPAREAARPAYLPPPAEPGEPYRPLSALALAGLGLALFYALIIVVGGAIAYSTGDSFLLSFWTVLLPLAALAVSWAARRSILGSEGALGGLRLTGWGIGLSLVFGLSYWSYVAATIMATRQQAAAFVEAKFLPALAKGRVDEAFILTFAPPRPNVDAALHGFIEANFDTPPSQKSNGKFTSFAESNYVRLMGMPGETRWERLETGMPFQERGALHVPITYRVQTPENSFDLLVLATAQETRSREAPGRPWQVNLNRTGILTGTEAWNDAGSLVLRDVEPTAREFVAAWVQQLGSTLDVDRAYRYTLPPARRATLAPKARGKSEAELNKLAETDPEVRDFLAGLKEFRAGAVVRADKGTFWAATPQQRDRVIRDVKKRFLAAYASPGWLTIPRDAVPAWTRDGDTLRFYYDGHIFLLPEFVAGARVVVEGSAKTLTDPALRTPDAWHVVALELLSVHAAPKPESPKSGAQ